MKPRHSETTVDAIIVGQVDRGAQFLPPSSPGSFERVKQPLPIV